MSQREHNKVDLTKEDDQLLMANNGSYAAFVGPQTSRPKDVVEKDRSHLSDAELLALADQESRIISPTDYSSIGLGDVDSHFAYSTTSLDSDASVVSNENDAVYSEFFFFLQGLQKTRVRRRFRIRRDGSIEVDAEDILELAGLDAVNLDEVPEELRERLVSRVEQGAAITEAKFAITANTGYIGVKNELKEYMGKAIHADNTVRRLMEEEQLRSVEELPIGYLVRSAITGKTGLKVDGEEKDPIGSVSGMVDEMGLR